MNAAVVTAPSFILPLEMTAALDASPDIQVLLADDQTILFANAAFRAVTPDEIGPLAGLPLATSLMGRDARRAASRRITLDAVGEAMRTRALVQPPVFRYDVQKDLTQPPRETWWSLSAAPLTLGGRPCLLMTVRDVTAAGAPTRDAGPDVAPDALVWAERRRLSQMFDQAPDLMALVVGPDHVVELVNPALKRAAGAAQMLGRSLRDVVRSEQGREIVSRLDEAWVHGRSFTAHALPIRMTADTIEDRFLDLTLQPLTNENGQVEAVFCRGQDVTDQVRAEAVQRFLRDELAHGQGNLLAVVLALAEQSAASAVSPQAFRTAFAARLAALSAVHSLLNRAGPDLSAAALAASIARAARRDDPLFRGAAPTLSPRCAISLGLVFHELLQVADAASSSPVRIRASQDAGRVRLIWRARAQAEPWTDGDDFGRRMIDHVVRLQFQGEWSMRRRKETLVACFRFPRNHPAWAPAVAAA